MDNRKWEADAIASPPTAPASPSDGFPTNGNPQTAQNATEPGAWWFHAVGEELRAVIVAGGLTPNHTTLTQLQAAIAAQIAANIAPDASETVKGKAEIATQGEVNAGTDDARFVTPLKLKFGFAISLAANGYIKFPSFLGGVIIQWGKGSNSTAGEINEVASFPLTFPTSCLFVISGTLNSGSIATADTSYQVASYTASQITFFRNQSAINSQSAAPLFLAFGH